MQKKEMTRVYSLYRFARASRTCNQTDGYHTTIKIVRLSVTVGDRGKRRAARGWWLCLGGHGLHCSSAT